MTVNDRRESRAKRHGQRFLWPHILSHMLRPSFRFTRDNATHALEGFPRKASCTILFLGH